MISSRRIHARRGSTIIEFALITLLLMVVVLAGIEFDRMVMVYTAIANSAKAGVRYAIVHGFDVTGNADPQSGPADNPPWVIAEVKGFASAAVLDPTALTNATCSSPNSQGICVTYCASQFVNGVCPNGVNHTNTTGSWVLVRVVYPYDPFVALPLHVNLSSTAQGIVVF